MNQREFSFVGNNPLFLDVLKVAESLACSKAPFLITGEQGTGKRSLAFHIHSKSARKDKPFMVIDCSGSHQDVRNNILGYRDESTGKFHKGVFERANGGTVVLSHIEDLEESFQNRIYTIIQELPDYDIDLRVIATTTKNLSKYVGAGTFSRVLYSFFSATFIHVPALRERKDDINTLVDCFVTELSQKNSVQKPQVPSDMLESFKQEYWACNVRELKEYVEGCFSARQDNALTKTPETTSHKKVENSSYASGDNIKLMSLRDAEVLLIQKALMFTSENRTQAAKILGVSIRTLRNKINEYRVTGHSYFINLR
ncbi:MAG: sigma-54-dependent Fis family transcriptional regulator [Bacteriovoracaceae bacterium]|nr:sigma-54-dependent Fis family transcriptional regulator [Bacteriovoracaceae bacterium]